MFTVFPRQNQLIGSFGLPIVNTVVKQQQQFMNESSILLNEILLKSLSLRVYTSFRPLLFRVAKIGVVDILPKYNCTLNCTIEFYNNIILICASFEGPT